MDVYHDLVDDKRLITATGFRFTYENSRASSLLIEDLQISSGQLVVLCGKSGSGKSTFLRLINGLIPDYYEGKLEGQLEIANHLAGKQSVEECSKQVASVFQNPSSQFFHKYVKHELVLPGENHGQSAAGILNKLEKLTADFALEDYLERDLSTLSGGEKQKIALLTALMQDTDILVLDEPTANLDRSGIEQVASYLSILKQEGKTILIAEHRLDYLKDLADRYLYFDQGVLKRDYSKKEFDSLTETERHDLGLRSQQLSSSISRLEAKKQVAPSPLMGDLTIKNLCLQAGDQELSFLEEANFKSGAITALVGPNGKGKSTLAFYLAGLLDDEDATFSLNGHAQSAHERLKDTAFVLQEVALQLFSDSVQKELTLGLKKVVDSSNILENLGLKGLEERHPMTLSGGEMQRLVIASQVLTKKRVFIFDEPSSGLDYQQMLQVADLLKTLKEQGKIILLISHDEELLEKTADYFLTLN